ncbi:hypothetical protein Taro_049439 [Colocasia esculenta]|uniref:Uncharacterized protein n=1 Tax=Colocasia esculenta TaxID=4460 RepID=A0A843XAZ3_COLES|nr:hypothetical protein [Colocasia esculenta]
MPPENPALSRTPDAAAIAAAAACCPVLGHRRRRLPPSVRSYRRRRTSDVGMFGFCHLFIIRLERGIKAGHNSHQQKNEVEDINPQENEIELGDSDEDEHTSDQNESDNEDANAEFDISPASEDEMENIWFEDDVRLLQVGEERAVGGGPTTSADLPPAAGPMTFAPLPLAAGLMTTAPLPLAAVHADDETSHHEGEGSYNETMRAVWINEGYRNHRFTKRSDESVLDLHGKPLQEQIASICCIMFEEMQKKYETQLKRPPQFQELFDQTHKKTGTNDYISEKAREVAESYSRGMEERYRDDSQHPELDPDIWIAASGAPKKGHVYGFGHSLGTAKVISSCSSSVSHATSPFTTPAAPGAPQENAAFPTASFRRKSVGK